jgi:hypothetical protein
VLAPSASAEPSAASSEDPNHPSQWVFQNERIIGNGSFGVVYQAIVRQNQKARRRNRQLDTLMPHSRAHLQHTARSPRAHHKLSPKALGCPCFQEVAIKKVLQDKRFKVCAGPVCAPAEGMVGYGVCGLPKRLRILGPMRMQAVGRANGEGGQEGRYPCLGCCQPSRKRLTPSVPGDCAEP